MLSEEAGRNRAVFGALACLLLLYGLNAGYFFVGIFNDDARHILAARALLEGHFNDLSLPGAVPAVNLLPGYPLLLALPYAAGGEAAGRALSILFSLLAVFSAWRLLGKESRAAVVLFALHPVFVRYSGTLMTEPAYLFWSLSSLLWLRGLKRERIPAFTLWLVFAAWIRPHGFLLLAACLPFALGEARKKERAWLIVLAAAVFAAPYLRNLWTAGTPASYFDEFARSRGVLEPLGVLGGNVLSNLVFYFTAVPEMLAGGVRLPAELLYPWSLLAWFLLVRGFRAAWYEKDARERRPRLVYVFLVGAMSLLWVNHDERYVLILLPFLYESMLVPLRGKPEGRRRLLCAAVLALSSTSVLVGTCRTLAGGNPMSRPPRETIAWAKENTRPSDVFVAPYRQYVSYLTGRKTYNYFYYANPDSFFAFLLTHGVTHVWVDRSRRRIESTPSRRALLDRHARVMEERLSDPARFTLVYQNPGERLAVYAVVPSPGFLAARKELPALFEDLAGARWDTALERLERLEKNGAPLKRLDFLLGTTNLMAGRAGKALPYLEKACRAEPGFPEARRNLCRAYRETGAGPRARELCGE